MRGSAMHSACKVFVRAAVDVFECDIVLVAVHILAKPEHSPVGP
jgi:hypothetical protein